MIVGADGSVRMFDLRHLEHSTIIYEDPQHHPLLRLAWNKQDPNYLATMAMDAMEVCYVRPASLLANCIKYSLIQLNSVAFFVQYKTLFSGNHTRCKGAMHSSG